VRSAISVLGRLAGKDTAEGDASSLLDAKFHDMRIGAVLAPVSLRGHAIAIRKAGRHVLSLADYARQAAAEQQDPPAAEAEPPLAQPADLEPFLRWAVVNKKNILVSGGTSTGKTTFLNALLACVPDNERVLTIEDTAELKIGVDNYVGLEANEQGGVTVRALLKMALRMRPDRIILGEIRGAEAFDLLQALNTGHAGSGVSVHANSAAEALVRIETLVLIAGVQWPHDAVRAQVAQSFDYVVHMGRRAGRRIIQEIVALDPLVEGEYRMRQLWRG
jgi:Flp pilus assembly CpaF family ATPase